MKIYKDFEEVIEERDLTRPLVVTVGFFDGVHLGHRKLIDELKQIANQIKGDSLVITFDEHPTKVLHPDRPAPLVLSSARNKLRLLAYAGVEKVLMLHFTPELAATEARDFLSPLLERGELKAIVMGYDNAFGHRRSDMSISDYDDYITSWGVDLYRVSPYWVGREIVSSSAIRHHISDCNFPAAERLLGRPYSFLGTVGHGMQVGRTINYPTANISPLEPDIYLPAIGVYIAEVRLDEAVYPAMAYYGRRPTLAKGEPARLEAYLLDYRGDLYGREVEVGFKAFLRGDKRFDTLDDLADQIHKDERMTRDYFSQYSLTLPTDPEHVLDQAEETDA